MSFKVTDFGTNRKSIYDFLLMINANLPSILHGFGVLAFQMSEIAIYHYPLADVARNRSMDRWIAKWCSYNFAAGSFYTKKLCSRLFSRKVGFYCHKQRYRVFVPPFGGLRGNVHGSPMARWKARGRLPIGANWTVFASYHGWGAMSQYWSKSLC